MSEYFINAAIQPVAGTIDATRMSIGEPGLPRQFRWGTATFSILRVLRTWRETGPCRRGRGMQYARKHWFGIVDGAGNRMTISFERQARSRGNKCRWWLSTVDVPH